MRGTLPIDDGNRADLARPKPLPVPRPREAQSDTASPPQEYAANSDAAAFAQAMAGVRPLSTADRAELGTPNRHRPVLPSTAAAAPQALPADPALSPEELLRWALTGVTPLSPGDRFEVEQTRPAPEPIQRALDDRSVLRESIETPLSLEDRLDSGDEAVFLRAGLPRRVLTDLRRGRWTIQRELDLHGLTRDEARAALGEFLARCLVEGRRCVRLIHGKGLGSPGQFGILKHLSRGWLAQREEILAFCQARPHEGGSGALLVLLRASTASRGPRT